MIVTLTAMIKPETKAVLQECAQGLEWLQNLAHNDSNIITRQANLEGILRDMVKALLLEDDG